MAATRIRDPEATKKAIISAAEEIFLERGFGDTPLSLIAKKAGVTKSLIHHHFESKKRLWDEVKHAALCDYAAKQEEIQSRGEVTLEALRESMVAYFRMIQQNPKIIRLMAWMTIENLDGTMDICIHDQMIDTAVAQVEAAQRKGLVRNDITPFHIVMAFLTMVHGWFQDRYIFRKWLVSYDGADAMAVADDIFLESAMAFIASGVQRGEKD